MLRDSTLHPLRIDSLPICSGRLGLTLCPGKKGESVFGDRWDRNLDIDLDVIKSWGTKAVVTLIEEAEFRQLSVTGLGDALLAQGIEWHHFPICNLNAPTAAAMIRWRTLSPHLHSIFESGGRVLLHCRGGLGRAGTIAALLLIERGRSAHDAVHIVRRAMPGAVATDRQERFLSEWVHCRRQSSRQLHASLLGGAIGDSIGADIEFLSLSEIRNRFPDGVSELPRHMGVKGAITDDTQMTLFTAEGILRAHVRNAQKGVCHPPSVIHHALLRWLRTQGCEPKVETDDIGLINDSRLRVRRAPGNTCLSSLAASTHFGSLAQNDSKGCGSIMRVAPIALMFPRDQVRRLAIETSALTHGHATGQLAAAAWAEMLADVSLGSELEDAAVNAAETYAKLPDGGETARAIQAALNAPRDGTGETVESLGGGWIAEEALAIALYACLAGNFFEDALTIAAFHGGDSDSTAAIAGNMLGLLNPQAVLRHRWAECVEGADIISRIAQDYPPQLATTDAGEDIVKTYPGF